MINIANTKVILVQSSENSRNIFSLSKGEEFFTAWKFIQKSKKTWKGI